MTSKFILVGQCVAILGTSLAFAETSEETNIRFMAACMASAQLDDPFGSDASHHGYCRCRLDALAPTHSSDQINQISTYIEEANGGGVPRATSLIGTDLAANQTTASACQGRLNSE